MADREESFTAEVKIAGINPYADVPERVVKTLSSATKAAVLVKVAGTDDPLNGKDSTAHKEQRLDKDAARLQAIGRLASGDWFRSTFVSLKQGTVRLYLDKWMRETAGVGVGDCVLVTLKLDHDSRAIPLPGRLLEMLKVNAKAKVAWDALAPSRRREILTYLNFLKTPEALERNVQKTIAHLLELENTKAEQT